MGSSKTVCLSAVSSELGAHRARVAAELRRRGVSVLVQDDFRQGPWTLLEKLRDHIRSCDVVICLVGRAYGAEPPRPTDAQPRRSYTQWEFHYASEWSRRSGMPLLLYVADQDAPLPDVDQGAEERALQARFVASILESGLDYEPLESEDQLAIRVLHHDWGAGPRIAWRATLAVFLLGLGVASAIAVAATHRDLRARDRVTGNIEHRILSTVGEVLASPPQVVSTAHDDRVPVVDLPAPGFTEFVILHEEQIWDMRWTRRVSSSAIGPGGSALPTRATFRVEKAAPATTFALAARTSGTEILTRNLCSFPLRIYALRDRRLVGDQLLLERQRHYDVSRVPVGGEFVIRDQSTFWNSMQTAADQWVGFVGRPGQRSASILVIFPEDRPFDRFWATAAALNADGVRIEPTRYDSDLYYFLEDEQGRRWVYWEVFDPEPDFVYQLRWSW